ncbi:MAG: AAA family ATPase [Planctomycetota bacterium]|nr:AAA family ATPase [Planctomycetota bacterium]
MKNPIRVAYLQAMVGSLIIWVNLAESSTGNPVLNLKNLAEAFIMFFLLLSIANSPMITNSSVTKSDEDDSEIDPVDKTKKFAFGALLFSLASFVLGIFALRMGWQSYSDTAMDPTTQSLHIFLALLIGGLNIYFSWTVLLRNRLILGDVGQRLLADAAPDSAQDSDFQAMDSQRGVDAMNDEPQQGAQTYIYGVSIPEAVIRQVSESDPHDSALIQLANNLDDRNLCLAALFVLGTKERGAKELPGLKITPETPTEWDRLAARAFVQRDPRFTLAEALIKLPWWPDEEMRSVISDHLPTILERSHWGTEAIRVAEWMTTWNDIDGGINGMRTFLPAEFIDEVLKHFKIEQLNNFAQVWSPEDELLNYKSSVELSDTQHYESMILERLEADPARSMLLVGGAGVGKKTSLRRCLSKLGGNGWLIVEAAPQDLVAGMMFVGQMEERWKELMGLLSAPRTILFISDFAEMESAGRHMNNPVSLLDRLVSEIGRGKILTVGTLDSDEMERLLRKNRSVRRSFDFVEKKSPDENEIVDGLARWIDHENQNADHELQIEISDDVLKKVVRLSQQFLTVQEPFGSSFDLMRSIVDKKRKAQEPRIEHADAISAISDRSGMPHVLVDDEESLDPDEVQGFFEERIIGQEEAVRCMVDRITLLKAGLTDIGRPLGVFFFAGPTGTGKTESAKILAEYLFGSQDRLERLDMSELQTPGDLSRLVGQMDYGGGGDHRSLLDAVRRQPFSVVLLDEFEKAHPHVWDLFLQAFDDARMTDVQGNTVNLKHVVFILTSNVGAREAAQGSFGFNPMAGKQNIYEKALKETFRPEFLNRIDQVVTFRPFSRKEQRALLEMELQRVLSRRGLRDRPWAVEWEESAINFLLSRGLTAELGARPLRRAVERYALTPIAKEMVAHDIPKEDQFLFVRSDGQNIIVDFVDPDVYEKEEQEAALPPIEISGEDHRGDEKDAVARIALRGVGRLEEVLTLAESVEALEARIESDEWDTGRSLDLEKMLEPGFWDDSSARLPILASAELRDRIDSGTVTARSLLERLGSDAENSRDRYPADLIRRLALQVHLLDNAVEVLDRKLPQDAFIRIAPVQRDRESRADGIAWAEQVREMVKSWARKRNMHLEEFAEIDDHEGGFGGWIAAINGFAAWAFLEPLKGIHELERPDASRNDRRLHVRIDVSPRPLGNVPGGDKAVPMHAIQTLDDAKTVDEVVRRYRIGENPKLVDLRQGWRCTYPGDALDGDFDLVGSLATVSR